MENNSTAAVLGVHHGTQLCPLICDWIIFQKAVTKTIRLIVYTVQLKGGKVMKEKHHINGFTKTDFLKLT